MDSEDEAAIAVTLVDYFEAWFDGDAARMERALHPDLAKRGVGVDASGAQIVASMTAPQMIGWTRDGDGVAERPDDPEIVVEVHAVHDRIACASVRNAVYVEYAHLARTASGWQVLNTVYERVRPVDSSKP